MKSSEDVKKIIELYMDVAEYDDIGVRGDSINFPVGAELEKSIDNTNRDDIREFSDYDANAPRLKGTSVYRIGTIENDIEQIMKQYKLIMKRGLSSFKYVNLVVGYDVGAGEDDFERLFDPCIVIEKIR